MMEEDEDVANQPYIIITNASTFREKDIGIRTVVGITCCLSIIGSLLIILSYIVQNKRTKTREILVHISVLDLGVSLANLIGVSVYFDQYYHDVAGTFEASKHIDNMCKTQAFFAAFCTLGSVFWTTALAGYLYVIIFYHKEPKYSIIFVRLCYFLCYGLALAVSLWLLLRKKLGYAPYDSSGWCSLIAKDPETGENDLLVVIFAHDLWMILSIFLIVVLCVVVRIFIANQVSSEDTERKKFWSAVDYKFILIPVFFVLLRVWSVLSDFLVEYAHLDTKEAPVFWKIIIYLSGIGDSGQGITNAILFILFTKSARTSFVNFVCCRRKRNRLRIYNNSPPSPLPKMMQESGSNSVRYGSTGRSGKALMEGGMASINPDFASNNTWPTS